MSDYRSRAAFSFVLLLTALLLASACSSDDDSEDEAIPGSSTNETTAESEDKSGAKSFTATPRIWLSRDTTFITGPLTKDGYPDYVAAINSRAGEGVTAGNNAAVPLLRALGPTALRYDETRAQVLEQLGLKDLPKDGPYLVTWSDYVDERTHGHADADAIEDEYKYQLELALFGPWKKDDAPLVAEWMAENETPIDWAVEASRCTRCYVPIFLRSDDDSYGMGRALALADVRDLVRLLCCRANLRLGTGDVDAAWSDVMICFRLNRVYAQDTNTASWLVALSLDTSATQCARALAQHAAPTPEQVQRYLADLESLPPLPQMSELIDRDQRFSFLDTVLRLARVANGDLVIEREEDHPFLQALRLGDVVVDFEEALRQVNLLYDRQVRICSRMPLHERMRAANQMDDELDELAESFNFPEDFAEEAPPEEPPTSVTGRVGRAVDTIKERLAPAELPAEEEEEPTEPPPATLEEEAIQLRDEIIAEIKEFEALFTGEPFTEEQRWIVSQLKALETDRERGRYVFDLMKGFHTIVGMLVKTEIRAEATMELLRVTFALSAYRTRHGTSPDSLDELAPDFIPAVPLDPFTGRAFDYQKTGGDYFVQSAGEDGEFRKDDLEDLAYMGGDVFVRSFGSREAALELIKRRGGTYDAEQRKVDLSETETSADELQYLRGLKDIEILDLEFSDIYSTGIMHLRALTNLKELNLSYNSVYDEAMVSLTHLTKLKSLSLSGTRITDKAVDHLVKLKHLEYLGISRTRITEQGVRRLQEALPDTHVSWR